jgi:hypothetical protein
VKAFFVLLTAAVVAAAGDNDMFARAREHSRQFDTALAASQRVLKVWLTHADPETLLLPDRVEGDKAKWVYTPHNSGADLYPYLIVTAQITDPQLYSGRMMEMLRNEIRYTNAKGSVPGNYTFGTRQLGPPSMFGAGEYAKDGHISVTEYLGRTPWFYRMVDMTTDALDQSPVDSKFGKLPASDAELNGDFLQTLFRLIPMTGDPKFLEHARRIADAYIEEVLPANSGVPSGIWNFSTHSGDGKLKLRDHGNEAVVGLTMAYITESRLGSPRAAKYRPVIERMLDRVLASANPDGLLYNEVDAKTLKPLNSRLSDNWGYVYAAMYMYYQSTGETKYRDAVRRVLGNLPKYRNQVWEGPEGPPPGRFDGYADSIEGAIYLVNREPVPEALDWIDSEMKVMLGMQKPDGHVEYWYGEGNFNRTAFLWAFMKSQGVRPVHWTPGVGVGAVRDGSRLLVHLAAPSPARVQFDFARHRRVLNLDRNYARLNEFPEWYTVDENTLYSVRRPAEAEGLILLGSELIAGISLMPGDWIVQPLAR